MRALAGRWIIWRECRAFGQDCAPRAQRRSFRRVRGEEGQRRTSPAAILLTTDSSSLRIGLGWSASSSSSKSMSERSLVCRAMGRPTVSCRLGFARDAQRNHSSPYGLIWTFPCGILRRPLSPPVLLWPVTNDAAHGQPPCCSTRADFSLPPNADLNLRQLSNTSHLQPFRRPLTNSSLPPPHAMSSPVNASSFNTPALTPPAPVMQHQPSKNTMRESPYLRLLLSVLSFVRVRSF